MDLNIPHVTIIGKVHSQIKNTYLLLLAVVLFIRLDHFGISCWVLEISGIEMSAFSRI